MLEREGQLGHVETEVQMLQLELHRIKERFAGSERLAASYHAKLLDAETSVHTLRDAHAKELYLLACQHVRSLGDEQAKVREATLQRDQAVHEVAELRSRTHALEAEHAEVCHRLTVTQASADAACNKSSDDIKKLRRELEGAERERSKAEAATSTVRTLDGCELWLRCTAASLYCATSVRGRCSRRCRFSWKRSRRCRVPMTTVRRS